MTTPRSTRQQDAQLDELCERHGTLAITMLATRPGYGTMIVDGADGSEVRIAPNGEREQAQQGR